MRSGSMTLPIAALLLTWLAGCVSVPSVTVSDTARAICPTPLTASQALRIADALDALPPGDDINIIANHLERLDDAARICRGRN
jgi:TusA-related sulfurtransferase